MPTVGFLWWKFAENDLYWKLLFNIHDCNFTAADAVCISSHFLSRVHEGCHRLPPSGRQNNCICRSSSGFCKVFWNLPCSFKYLCYFTILAQCSHHSRSVWDRGFSLIAAAGLPAPPTPCPAPPRWPLRPGGGRESNILKPRAIALHFIDLNWLCSPLSFPSNVSIWKFQGCNWCYIYSWKCKS